MGMPGQADLSVRYVVIIIAIMIIILIYFEARASFFLGGGGGGVNGGWKVVGRLLRKDAESADGKRWRKANRRMINGGKV